MTNTFRSKRHLSSILFIVFIALLLMQGSAFAKSVWMPFDENSKASGSNISLSSTDQVNLEINGIWLDEQSNKKGMFIQADLSGGAGLGLVGEPRLPVIRRRVAVPYGGEVSVKAIAQNPVVIELTAPLSSMQAPIFKIEGAYKNKIYDFKPETYAGLITTGSFAKVIDVQIMRGVRHAIIEFYPVQYDAEKGQLEIYRNLQVKVLTKRPQLAYTITMLKKTLPGLKHSVEASILGVNMLDSSKAALPDSPIHFVVVIPDHSISGFETAMQDLIDWKIEKGFKVTVLKTSETGSTKEEIKAAIRNLYESPAADMGVPAYLLLVGDVEHIPYWEGTGEGENQAADMYFATMDAPDSNYTGDRVPDFHVGRFSVHDVDELEIVVGKTLRHEKPTDLLASWYSNSLWVASEDHEAMGQASHEWVSTGVIGDGMTRNTAYEKVMGSSDASIAAKGFIEAGQSIINYSGHGSHDTWVCVPLDNAYLNALEDSGAYPFVITNACQCGQFQHNSSGDCLSEAWFKSPGAAVGSWAASNNSLWDEDDLIEKAIWSAFFPSLRQKSDDPHMANYPWPSDDSYSTMGAATDMSLLLFYERADSTWSVQYAIEEYNLLGDPSVDIWTKQPATLSVTNPAAVVIGQANFNVTVMANGVAVKNALVALSTDNEIAVAAYSNASGEVSLSLAGLETPGDLHLVITGHNLQPYFDDIQIVPPTGAFVSQLNLDWDDSGAGDSVGNGNGQASPGEIMELTIDLKNFGTETALNVNAILSTTDACATVQRSESAYGDMVADAEDTGDETYLILVNTCQNNHRVEFVLDIDSDFDSWSVPIYLLVGNALQGSVLTLTGDNPVQGAVLSYDGPKSGNTIIGSDGSFVIQGLETGSYLFVASHPDYLSEEANVIIPADESLDIKLGRPDVLVSPDEFAVAVMLGSSQTERDITIRNNGDKPLNYQLTAGYVNGDDLFGYRWGDSGNGVIPYQWYEISMANKTNLILDDDDFAEISLPFDFSFYGMDFSNLFVGSNGYVTFGAGSKEYASSGISLPDSSDNVPQGLVAALFDDLDPTAGGSIYYGLVGNLFVVTFDGISEYSSKSGDESKGKTYTFQFVFDAFGGIFLNYKIVEGSEYNIGIQNTSGTSGMTIAAMGSDLLQNEFTIAISTSVSWLSIAANIGILNPDTESNVELVIDASGLVMGEYFTYVRVLTNDPDTPVSTIPITLLVDGVDSDNDGDPDLFDCMPDDENIYHGALEICDGIDNDCSGTTDELDPAIMCSVDEQCKTPVCMGADGCAFNDAADWSECIGILKAHFACFAGQCEALSDNDNCNLAFELGLNQTIQSSVKDSHTFKELDANCLGDNAFDSGYLDVFFKVPVLANKQYDVELIPESDASFGFIAYTDCDKANSCISAATNSGSGQVLGDFYALSDGYVILQVVTEKSATAKASGDFSIKVTLHEDVIDGDIDSTDGDIIDGDVAEGEAITDGDQIVDGDEAIDGDMISDGDIVVDVDQLSDGDIQIDGDTEEADIENIIDNPGISVGCSQTNDISVLLLMLLLIGLRSRQVRIKD